MASPLTPRSIRPTPLETDLPPTGPDPFDGLRPLPPEPITERLRRWMEAKAPGSGSGDVADGRGRGRGLRLRTGGRGSDTSAHHLRGDEPSGHGGPDRRGGNRLGLLATIAVVVAAAGVAWWLLRPPAAPIEAVLPVAGQGGSAAPRVDAGSGAISPTTPTGAGSGPDGGGAGDPAVGGATPTTAPALVVQAAGAVASPGVYRMAPGARIDDLVRAAGGTTPEADVDRVNLAAPLADGQRVWVPRQGETEVPDVVSGGGPSGTPSGTPSGAPAGSGTGGGSGSGSGAPAGSATPAIVDLNTATADELESLPGVGPATATAILSYRETNGPFASVDELLEVRGIGDAKLEQIRPLARV